MELTPSQVTNASFRTVRKGYDPDEVDDFLGRVAAALEACQQQATAMEARARAAVARLQEVQAAAEHAEAEPVTAGDVEADAERVRVAPDEAEMISRTLLLAQRTADSTIADAEREAERIRHDARSEADATLDSTREMSARLLEDAKAEARETTETERQAAVNEVESLKARREFLVGDVDQLEQFLIEQRDRLRGAARQIEALCERVPAGLGSVSRPALSASDDEPGDETAELFLPPEAQGPFASADELADAVVAAEADGLEPLASVGDGTEPDDFVVPDANAPRLPTRGDDTAAD